jgi:hypothetical protein
VRRAIVVLVALVAGCPEPTDHERILGVRKGMLAKARERLDRGEKVELWEADQIRTMCAASKTEGYPELAAECTAIQSRLPPAPTFPDPVEITREGNRKMLRDAAQRVARGEKVSEADRTAIQYACAHDPKLRPECEAVKLPPP